VQPTPILPTPAPFQTSSPIEISPSSVRIPSRGVTITITGSGFARPGEGHMTNWTTWVVNGSEQVLSTHYVDSSHITADVPTDLLRQSVTALIYVTTACDQCDSHPNHGPATFEVEDVGYPREPF
jgi:IPT/TIG domain